MGMRCVSEQLDGEEGMDEPCGGNLERSGI